VASIKQKGQHKKLTDREAEIVRKVKKNPRLSAPELKAELFDDHGKTVSAQTVRRTIKKQGYNGRVARKKPLLADRNRKLRENFARSTPKSTKAGATMSFSWTRASLTFSAVMARLWFGGNPIPSSRNNT